MPVAHMMHPNAVVRGRPLGAARPFHIMLLHRRQIMVRLTPATQAWIRQQAFHIAQHGYGNLEHDHLQREIKRIIPRNLGSDAENLAVSTLTDMVISGALDLAGCGVVPLGEIYNDVNSVEDVLNIIRVKLPPGFDLRADVKAGLGAMLQFSETHLSSIGSSIESTAVAVGKDAYNVGKDAVHEVGHVLSKLNPFSW